MPLLVIGIYAGMYDSCMYDTAGKLWWSHAYIDDVGLYNEPMRLSQKGCWSIIAPEIIRRRSR